MTEKYVAQEIASSTAAVLERCERGCYHEIARTNGTHATDGAKRIARQMNAAETSDSSKEAGAEAERRRAEVLPPAPDDREEPQ